VVIDAFRSINPQLLMMGQEPRQTTSNLGHLNKPSIQALIHGLNRHYYSLCISYRKNELEEKMLMWVVWVLVWWGVVWCGVVWCGVVWCGVVWRGVVWCGVGGWVGARCMGLCC
jgi:hypothetical protein